MTRLWTRQTQHGRVPSDRVAMVILLTSITSVVMKGVHIGIFRPDVHLGYDGGGCLHVPVHGGDWLQTLGLYHRAQ